MSATATDMPLLAASSATPAPVAPIPTTSTSSGAAVASATSAARWATENGRLTARSSSHPDGGEGGEQAGERRIEVPPVGQGDQRLGVARRGRHPVVVRGDRHV